MKGANVFLVRLKMSALRVRNSSITDVLPQLQNQFWEPKSKWKMIRHSATVSVTTTGWSDQAARERKSMLPACLPMTGALARRLRAARGVSAGGNPCVCGPLWLISARFADRPVYMVGNILLRRTVLVPNICFGPLLCRCLWPQQRSSFTITQSTISAQP